MRIAVLMSISSLVLFNACAPRLMPHEIAAQPTVKNEIVAVKYQNARRIALISRIGKDNHTSVVISGPFTENDLIFLVDPQAVRDDFSTIRKENSWLILSFNCKGLVCEARVYERRKSEFSLYRDWWYEAKFHPRVSKKGKEEWLLTILEQDYKLLVGWE